MFPFEYFKINPKYLHYEFNYIAFMIRILKSHIHFSFLPDTMSQGSNHGPLRIHKVGDDSIIQSEINYNEYYYLILAEYMKHETCIYFSLFINFHLSNKLIIKYKVTNINEKIFK